MLESIGNRNESKNIKRSVGIRYENTNLSLITRSDGSYITSLPPPSVCLLNVRFVRNFLKSIYVFVAEKIINLYAITETCLIDMIDHHTLISLPHGDDFQHVPRQENRTINGVALLYIGLIGMLFIVNYDNIFECCKKYFFNHCASDLNITGSTKNTECIEIHTFFDEWALFLKILDTSSYGIAIVGDIDFHLEDSNDLCVKRLHS